MRTVKLSFTFQMHHTSVLVTFLPLITAHDDFLKCKSFNTPTTNHRQSVQHSNANARNCWVSWPNMSNMAQFQWLRFFVLPSAAVVSLFTIVSVYLAIVVTENNVIAVWSCKILFKPPFSFFGIWKPQTGLDPVSSCHWYLKNHHADTDWLFELLFPLGS